MRHGKWSRALSLKFKSLFNALYEESYLFIGQIELVKKACEETE